MKPFNYLSFIIIILFSFFIFHFSFVYAGDEKTVARVDDSVITVDDFTSYINARPLAVGKGTGREAVDARLEEMITAETLYREALRLGIDRDPEIRQILRQLLAQKLLDKKVNRPAWERKITEDELQKYYKDHIDEFVRPERVRLADIFIAAPKEAGPDVRKEKRSKSEEALAKVLTRQGRFIFGEVLAQYSDKPANYTQGDTGFFDREGAPIGLDSKMVEVAFKLSRNGEVYDKVIETADGFHIIMLVGRQSAVAKELKDVSSQLEQRIRAEEQNRKRDEYIKSLRQQAEVHIDEQTLGEIIEQLKEGKASGGEGEALMPPGLPGEK